MTLRISILLHLCVVWTLGCGRAPEHEDRPAPPAPNKVPRSVEAKTSEIEPLPPSGEGMWPWNQLAELDGDALKKRGLEISLAEIWTPGKGGLARAVAGLRGCTASFVSDDGLLLTNHHCVHRAIQRNSTPKKNLLEEGYLARSREEELDGHGLKVLVFKSQTDVTEKILGGMAKDLSDLARLKHIEAREKEIVKKCEEKPNTRCSVSRNNDGLSFELLEKLEIRDVRLVAAPPRSIGEFGGEVDNWMWPRHSMDFSFVRAYVDKDGKAVEYAAENVPYKPERHFKVSAAGVSKGDLVMVMGTPYHTSRYRTAYAVEQAFEWYYPLRVSIFSEWIETLEGACKEIPESCLLTASTKKGINNGLTNARGMVTGLARAGVVARKKAEEKEWLKWVVARAERKARFGGALNNLISHLEGARQGRDRDFLVRYMLSTRAAHLLGFARMITKWAREQEKPDGDREPGFQDRDRDELKSRIEQAQRSLHVGADARVLAMFLSRMGLLPQAERLVALDKALGGDWGEASIARYLERLYRGTGLGDAVERVRLFDTPLSGLKTSTDSMIVLALALAPELDAWDERNKSFDGAMSRLRPPYIESLVAMKGNRFYPDANGSPRVSFATVAGYRPRDGVRHTPFTTLGGLAAKNTGRKPFDALSSVIDAVKNRDFGSYLDSKRDDVPVCFLSNADTTGGNSGSPAVDGKGRLVGLNFDRVYENIAGDYGYNPQLSRNIMVDVRSILWYLDTIIDADNLLGEMGVR
ncbi:MAG: S46 family peptidase [Deltaproteobacteria bacterium]|nr:S46 family peptidase [Deltaproteobacteria bacterium]